MKIPSRVLPIAIMILLPAIARTMPEVEALRPRLRAEPLFAVVKIAHAEVPRVLPPRDGGWLASRFRRALGVAEP